MLILMEFLTNFIFYVFCLWCLQTSNKPWIQEPSAPCIFSTACIVYANIKKQLKVFFSSNLCWFKKQDILISYVGIRHRDDGFLCSEALVSWVLNFFLFLILKLLGTWAISQDGYKRRSWNNLGTSITLHELLARIPGRMPAGWLTIKWVLFFSSWLIFKHLLKDYSSSRVVNRAPTLKRN